MSKVLVIITIVLNSIIGFGQLELRNTTLEHPDQLVLYRQLYNLIEFRSATNDSIVKVLIENDTVQRHVNTFFIVPDLSHETIDITAITLKGDSTFFTLEVIDFPKLELMLGDKKAGDLSRSYLLENPGLLYDIPMDSRLPFIYPVKSDLLIINKRGKEKLVKINGNAFSEKQMKQLAKLQSGETLVFKNSISSCSTCLDSRVEAELKFQLVD